MKIRRVTRYISDCGKGFWKKESCEKHEKNCKCWKNPKYKTCLTCKFMKKTHDSNGMEHEPRYLHTWVEIECLNPNFNYDTHFNQAHEKAADLCINCPVWEGKSK